MSCTRPAEVSSLCSGGGGGRLSCEPHKSSMGSKFDGGGGGGRESRLKVELNIALDTTSLGGGGKGRSSIFVNSEGL